MALHPQQFNRALSEKVKETFSGIGQADIPENQVENSEMWCMVAGGTSRENCGDCYCIHDSPAGVRNHA